LILLKYQKIDQNISLLNQLKIRFELRNSYHFDNAFI